VTASIARGVFDLRQLGEIKRLSPGIGTFIMPEYSRQSEKPEVITQSPGMKVPEKTIWAGRTRCPYRFFGIL